MFKKELINLVFWFFGSEDCSEMLVGIDGERGILKINK